MAGKTIPEEWYSKQLLDRDATDEDTPPTDESSTSSLLSPDSLLTTSDRIRGALVGVCVADALGVPMKGKKRAPKSKRVSGLIESARPKKPAGYDE
jgi:hypothetical protein